VERGLEPAPDHQAQQVGGRAKHGTGQNHPAELVLSDREALPRIRFAAQTNTKFGWLPLDPLGAARTGLRERCVISSSHALTMRLSPLVDDGRLGLFHLGLWRCWY
jgi:hypothetical protein